MVNNATTATKIISFFWCKNKRRQIENKLFTSGQERACINESLTTIITSLFMSDQVLTQTSGFYKLNYNQVGLVNYMHF